MTDQQLLELLHTEPQKGLENIIRQYAGLIYTIAYSKLSSVCTQEDVEECVSDIFVLFYRQRETVDLSRGSVKSFLMILAKRTAIKRYKKACGEKADFISIDDETTPLTTLAAEQDTGEQVFEKETRLALINAVKALGEPDCSIILRKYYLGETAKQIAEHVQLSQNAVEKRISRGLKRLNSILGGMFDG